MTSRAFDTPLWVRNGQHVLIIDSSFEMPITPWSSSSSLVSDRIRPHPAPPKQQHQNKVKSKGKAPTPEPPKSKAVRVLEARLYGARGSNGSAKDPKGGCFCQGKSPALRAYPHAYRPHIRYFCWADPAYLPTSSKSCALEPCPDMSTMRTDPMYAQPTTLRVSAL